MSKKSILFISGVPNINIGAGYFINFLDKEIKRFSNIKFLYASKRIEVGFKIKNKDFFGAFLSIIGHFYCRLRLILLTLSPYIKQADYVVLFHFQYIGLKLSTNIIRKRNKNTYIYLLDSGYFCIKSYNYISNTYEECIKCIGGNFEYIKKNNCRPFPSHQNNMHFQLKKFLDFSINHSLSFFSQNQTQTILAKKHFGPNVLIKQVGLWTSDLPQYEEINSIRKKINTEDFILFHGAPVSAKGVLYALKIAKLCSEIKFVFPFSKNSIHYDIFSKNIKFMPMNWQTGLIDYMLKAKIVLVPSLWSAPIETSLVKSMLYARAVASTNNVTSFSSEINEKIIIKLPREIDLASKVLTEAYLKNWKPNEIELNSWIKLHYKNNQNVLQKMIESLP